jgi:hypothetical protein
MSSWMICKRCLARVDSAIKSSQANRDIRNEKNGEKTDESVLLFLNNRQYLQSYFGPYFAFTAKI